MMMAYVAQFLTTTTTIFGNRICLVMSGKSNYFLWSSQQKWQSWPMQGWPVLSLEMVSERHRNATWPQLWWNPIFRQWKQTKTSCQCEKAWGYLVQQYFIPKTRYKYPIARRLFTTSRQKTSMWNISVMQDNELKTKVMGTKPREHQGGELNSDDVFVAAPTTNIEIITTFMLWENSNHIAVQFMILHTSLGSLLGPACNIIFSLPLIQTQRSYLAFLTQ
jgi:hypothetical protein